MPPQPSPGGEDPAVLSMLPLCVRWVGPKEAAAEPVLILLVFLISAALTRFSSEPIPTSSDVMINQACDKVP